MNGVDDPTRQCIARIVPHRDAPHSVAFNFKSVERHRIGNDDDGECASLPGRGRWQGISQSGENLQRMHSTRIEFSFDPIHETAAQTRKLKFKSCSNSLCIPSHPSHCHRSPVAAAVAVAISTATSCVSVVFRCCFCFGFCGQRNARCGEPLSSQALQICNCLFRATKSVRRGPAIEDISRVHTPSCCARSKTQYLHFGISMATVGISAPVVCPPAHP